MSPEEKYALITKHLEEVSGMNKEKILKIIEERPLKVYWGTAITGKPHIAYFLPLMKIKDMVEAGCKVKVLFADIHGRLETLEKDMHTIEYRLVWYQKTIQSMLESINVDISSIEFVLGSNYQFKQEYVYDLIRLSNSISCNSAKRATTKNLKANDNPSLGSLIYPCMQALDEVYLDIDAEIGGLDQRKLFMFSKDHLKKIGYKNKTLYLINPLLPGFGHEKMSASSEKSKIDLADTRAIIEKKISNVFCEPGIVENNSILSMFKFLIFPMNSFTVTVSNKVYKTYEELEQDYTSMTISPKDIKEAVIEYLENMVRPVRQTLEKHTELLKKAYPKGDKMQ